MVNDYLVRDLKSRKLWDEVGDADKRKHEPGNRNCHYAAPEDDRERLRDVLEGGVQSRTGGRRRDLVTDRVGDRGERRELNHLVFGLGGCGGRIGHLRGERSDGEKREDRAMAEPGRQKRDNCTAQRSEDPGVHEGSR